MQKVLLALIPLTILGWSPNSLAQQPQTPPSGGTVQRLGQMFSPQIQTTLNACWRRGKVNLAAGAGTNGIVWCGDGTSEPQVTYQDYLSTIADILAASSLVGFRSVIQSDSRFTPELLSSFVSNSEGIGVLRTTIQAAIFQSELVPTSSNESSTILTNAVMERLTPVLRDPSALNTLLGTPQQYSRVVNAFCNAPGMSIEQARSSVMGLSNLQLYAICIQESGVARDILPARGNAAPQNNR